MALGCPNVPCYVYRKCCPIWVYIVPIFKASLKDFPIPTKNEIKLLEQKMLDSQRKWALKK